MLNNIGVNVVAAVLTASLAYWAYSVRKHKQYNMIIPIAYAAMFCAAMEEASGTGVRITLVVAALMIGVLGYLLIHDEYMRSSKSANQLDWLEIGNQHMGFRHIVLNHGQAFAAEGIKKTEIDSLVTRAFNSWLKVDGGDRKGQRLHIRLTALYKFGKQHVVIIRSNSGYLVTAYPGDLEQRHSNANVQEVHLMLEYGCYPVWLYDEQGRLIANDLPKKLRHNRRLDEKLLALQGQYDALFTDTEYEFKYNGFENQREEREFLHDFNNIQRVLKAKTKGKYVITNKINEQQVAEPAKHRTIMNVKPSKAVFRTAQPVINAEPLMTRINKNGQCAETTVDTEESTLPISKPLLQKMPISTVEMMNEELTMLYDSFQIEYLDTFFDKLVAYMVRYEEELSPLYDVSFLEAKDCILGHTDEDLTKLITKDRNLMARGMKDSIMLRSYILRSINSVGLYMLEEGCPICRKSKLRLATTTDRQRVMKYCPECDSQFYENQFFNGDGDALPASRDQVMAYLKHDEQLKQERRAQEAALPKNVKSECS